MMSTVRYPSGKKVDLQTKTRLRNFVFVLAAIGLMVLFKEVALLCACSSTFRAVPPLARGGPAGRPATCEQAARVILGNFGRWKNVGVLSARFRSLFTGENEPRGRAALVVRLFAAIIIRL